jgi:hypothetical protein
MRSCGFPERPDSFSVYDDTFGKGALSSCQDVACLVAASYSQEARWRSVIAGLYGAHPVDPFGDTSLGKGKRLEVDNHSAS